MIGDPTRPRTMSEVALRLPGEHLNWDRLLRRTLRFNDAPAAPVTAADIDRDSGSDLRTR